MRDAEGRQKRFFGVSEMVEEVKKSGKRQALLLIPVGYLNQLTKSEQFESEVLGSNDDLAIVIIKLRQGF